MKYFFMVITLAFQFLVVKSLKLLDNFAVIIGVFALCILIGAILRFSKANVNQTTANFGWGLLYGSLSAIGMVVIFMIWLSFNFPK